MEVETSILVTLYVLLLGPLKIMTPFWTVTARADRALQIRIGNRAVLVATIVSLIFALFGAYVMARFNLTEGVLAITMGLFFGHWAVQNALGPPPVDLPDESTIDHAIFPVAMPGIVPPHGIALLILSVDLMDVQVGSGLLYVLALVVGIMILNWGFMLAIPTMITTLGLPFWRLVSKTTGVIMSAIALQMIVTGVRALGFGT